MKLCEESVKFSCMARGEKPNGSGTEPQIEHRLNLITFNTNQTKYFLQLMIFVFRPPFVLVFFLFFIFILVSKCMLKVNGCLDSHFHNCPLADLAQLLLTFLFLRSSVV